MKPEYCALSWSLPTSALEQMHECITQNTKQWIKWGITIPAMISSIPWWNSLSDQTAMMVLTWLQMGLDSHSCWIHEYQQSKKIWSDCSAYVSISHSSIPQHPKITDLFEWLLSNSQWHNVRSPGDTQHKCSLLIRHT